MCHGITDDDTDVFIFKDYLQINFPVANLYISWWKDGLRICSTGSSAASQEYNSVISQLSYTVLNYVHYSFPVDLPYVHVPGQILYLSLSVTPPADYSSVMVINHYSQPKDAKFAAFMKGSAYYKIHFTKTLCPRSPLHVQIFKVLICAVQISSDNLLLFHSMFFPHYPAKSAALSLSLIMKNARIKTIKKNSESLKVYW